MTPEDRAFYGFLLFVFGPLFIAGGWLASFTIVGFFLILAGTAMLIVAPLLLRSLKAAVAAGALGLLGWTWPFLLSI